MSSQRQKTVLITRPATEADEFAREIEASGFRTFIEPVIGIVPLSYDPPSADRYSGVVFTSANGVRAFGMPEGFYEKTVFAVGNYTAQEARKQGYATVLSAEGNGNALASLIERKASGKLLYVRGEHTAQPMEQLFGQASAEVDPLIVYTVRAEDSLSKDCRHILENGTIDIVTFFSKRTAEIFLKLVFEAGLAQRLAGIKVLCISQPVLECVRSVDWAGAYSAERPDRASMLALIKTL